MASLRLSGWKFRRKGEFAHYWSICRRDDCSTCDRGYVHAFCDERTVADLLDLPGLSRSRPPHRACQLCTEIVGERERYATAPWRIRQAMRPALRPVWLKRS